MKKHWFGPYGGTSRGEGHPIMFGDPMPSVDFDSFPDGGGYPKGFVEWALKKMHYDGAETVLHLCSGSMRSGLTIDIRQSCQPSIMADARRTPIQSESQRFILCDPPYSQEYAENLYATAEDYPSPSSLLGEAARILKDGGLFGLLHFQVPMVRKPMQLLGVWGVTTGSGYASRAWSLLKKQPRQLMLV